MSRVSEDDLLAAADWLEHYDGTDEGGSEDDDPTTLAMRRVAAHLRQEAHRRHEDKAVRKIVSQFGASPAAARRALRAHRLTSRS